MTKRPLPDPDAWMPRTAGLGSCFHRALTRWAEFHEQKPANGFSIAVGVLLGCGELRNVHAWLERGNEVVSAVDGKLFERDYFYKVCGIDPDTVRRINPRKIIRTYGVSNEGAQELVRRWGGRFHVNAEGGVVSDD